MDAISRRSVNANRTGCCIACMSPLQLLSAFFPCFNSLAALIRHSRYDGMKVRKDWMERRIEGEPGGGEEERGC